MASQGTAFTFDATDAELLAAQALGGMKNSGTSPKRSIFDAGVSTETDRPKDRRHSLANSVPRSPSSSTLISSPPPSEPSTSRTPIDIDEADKRFTSQMSTMPFVGTALRAYEQGKASSRVVKYGAEMMEGTVKMMTAPVMNRLPVNQLDEFAGRQLDRFGRLGGSGKSEDSATISPVNEADSHMNSSSRSPPRGTARGRKHLWIDDEGAESPNSPRPTKVHRSDSRDSTASASETAYSASISSGVRTGHRYQQSEASASAPSTHWQTILQKQDNEERRLRDQQNALESVTSSRALSYTPASSGQEVQVVSRSKWQAVLLEAGGIGAAVSEESMKRLKYCLQWLQYANHRIDQQIILLRSFIVSILPASTSDNPPTSTALVPFDSLQILAQVKRDLIDTIRQVVDVVSKYAGSALPEQAKASVRSFILMLPQRWSVAARQSGPEDLAAFGAGGSQLGLPSGAAMTASTRVLTLATESLDMMRSITSVFKESLDRAEAWVDRLQQLGLQRQQQQRQQQERLAVLPVPPEWDSNPSSTFATSSSTDPAKCDGNLSVPTPGAQNRSPSMSMMSSPPSTRAASVIDTDHGGDTETERDAELEEVDELMETSEAMREPGNIRRKSTRRKVAKENGDGAIGEMEIDG